MFKLVAFLQKRPKDRTILIGRIIFGLVIALLLGLNLDTITLHIPGSIISYETEITYSLFVLAFVPIFMGASGICLLKRKYLRIVQICFGLVLMIAGSWLIDVKVPAVMPSDSTQGSTVDYGAIKEITPSSRPLDVGFWMALLGIFPLLAGISGKCITSKCLKYGEVIKKIRV